jgi:nicotinamidase/pyrazinamidase
MSRPVAFIDVDTQIDFMDSRGRLYVQGAETLADSLSKLVKLAADRKIPLLQSLDTHLPDDPEFMVYPPHCIRGTSGHRKIRETEVPNARWVGVEQKDVGWNEGEALLIEKNTHSLYDNPNTPDIIRQVDAEEYVVFGVATDVCVRATTLALRDHGHRVTVVTDAVRPVREQDRRKALAELERAGVRLATTEEIVKKWG